MFPTIKSGKEEGWSTPTLKATLREGNLCFIGFLTTILYSFCAIVLCIISFISLLLLVILLAFIIITLLLVILLAFDFAVVTLIVKDIFSPFLDVGFWLWKVPFRQKLPRATGDVALNSAWKDVEKETEEIILGLKKLKKNQNNPPQPIGHTLLCQWSKCPEKYWEGGDIDQWALGHLPGQEKRVGTIGLLPAMGGVKGRGRDTERRTENSAP